MNFQVVWTPDAEEQLADVWLDASDRNSLTEAAHRIELALRENPVDIGDELFGTVRTVAYGPLGVDFEVIVDDVRVIVLAAWDTALGRPSPTGN